MKLEETGKQNPAGQWGENAQLALDTINCEAVTGIPTWMINVMEWSQLEYLSGYPPGSYPKNPVGVYSEFLRKAGICFVDQWIPENPLTMTAQGFDQETVRSATTGLSQINLDGMVIDSPEAVVTHMEQVLFPRWSQFRIELEKTGESAVAKRIAREAAIQKLLGNDILKGPYSGFFTFPVFLYGLYGYANYFMAYALYPEVIERGFKLYADTAVCYNRIAAQAIIEGDLPRLVRLDHDMADSRGTLVDIQSLEKLWFPHFCRSIQPFLDQDIRLIWHCDGNLMAMIPRLLDAGIGGFQGFQYEDGMDYVKICRMKTRDGDSLFIIAGVSVTTTLPFGTPGDIRRELTWLVENGPQTGLMLGCSSSITPGVPIRNMQTLIEGFAYYRQHRR
jgi:hypothetical protein